MTPLLEEYFNKLEYHRNEFQDPNLLLLMQVGSFYEAYEIDEPKKGCAKLISNILRMHLAKKNGKQNITENNPWMVGFPTYVLGKHLTKLNDEGYSVAIYDQKEDNKQERCLKGVYNYTIRYENEDELIVHSIEPKVFSIMIEKYYTTIKKIKECRYLISISIIEMNSGKIFVYENDTEDYQRDVQNIVLNYNPAELLICFKNFTENQEKEYKDILENSIQCKIISLLDNIHFDTKCSILLKIFEINDLSILGIEKHNALIDVLTLTLEYIKKHDPLLITKLIYPEFIEGYTNYMNFNRDAFIELNIMSICERRRGNFNSKKHKTLFELLSHNMTNLGKRCFENILRRPLYDEKIINERWDLIHYFQEKLNKDDIFFSMPDLEWYFLKWKRDKLSIKHLSQFLSCIKNIYLQNQIILNEYWKDLNIDELFNEIENIWNIDQMNDETNFFIEPIEEMLIYENKIKEIQEKFEKIDSLYSKYFKLQSSNENDFYLTSTIKKWESFQFDYKNDNSLYVISKNKSNVKLSFEELDKLSNQYKNLIQDQNIYIKMSFKSSSKNILNKFEKQFELIIKKLAMLDCFYNLAKFFKLNNYHRPELLKENNFEIIELRHPIYELIEKDKLFVPYNVELSNENNNLPLGLLIYGMNSSGKSTLLKSIGTAIWLSQCGLFVPAKLFKHSMIDGLYTKIGIYDNLFIGHSTFVAEMSELNYILKKSTSKSLLLCDELTSGTETKSATGIVSASLLYFLKNKIPFLLTTHLHLISKINEIINENKIKICHFEVSTFNNNSLLEKNINIRYDRMLKDGSGNDIYGIEIAKSLGLPNEFIMNAHDFRNRIDIFIHDKLDIKTSKYNKKLLINECYQCKSTIDLHTHHITPQEYFNENSIHSKNGLYNLVILCQKCHLKIHN
jgi:DNA mismatch repair protein MutS